MRTLIKRINVNIKVLHLQLMKLCIETLLKKKKENRNKSRALSSSNSTLITLVDAST